MHNSQSPIHNEDQFRNYKDRQASSGKKQSAEKNQDRSMTYSGNQSRFEQAAQMVKIDRPTDF
jgi:hypothetical protein